MLRKILPVILCMAWISGCHLSGGGSDNSTSSAELTGANAGGIWAGTFTSSNDGHARAFDGILSEDGRLFLVSPDSFQQLVGTVVVQGKTITGSLGLYELNEKKDAGIYSSSLDIQGRLIARQTLSGNYASANDKGTFLLTYCTLYRQQSAFSLISGVWFKSISSDFENIKIYPDGSTSGAIRNGYCGDGRSRIIDAGYNCYSLELTLSTPESMYFDGLACLGNDGTSDQLFVFLANAKEALLLVMARKNSSDLVLCGSDVINGRYYGVNGNNATEGSDTLLMDNIKYLHTFIKQTGE